MNSQFKRGVVELCVLKILSLKPMSTFELLEVLKKDLDVNENTIYPILRRLKQDKSLDHEVRSVGVGAPRKYFKTTEIGNEKLENLENDWNLFLKNVTKIMEGNYE